MSIITKLEAEEPLVLILSESGLGLSKFAANFLRENSLQTELLTLDEHFFEQADSFLKQKKQVYKIILLYGFGDYLPSYYAAVFSFIRKVVSGQAQKPTVVLISTWTSAFQIINQVDQNYADYLAAQERFVTEFLNNLPESQVFLAQDLLLAQEKISYPLLLFLAAFKEGYLLNNQKSFYLQDELSFFEIIKNRLIRPGSAEKFLIRGKAVSANNLIKKISYLYEQYFQKKLAILKLFAEEKPTNLLKEFAVVKNAPANINSLIDQKVRLLTNFNLAQTENPLSLEKLKTAVSQSEQKTLERSNRELQKEEERTFKSSFLDLFRKAQKPFFQAPQKTVYNEDLTGKIENLFSSQRSLEKQARQQKNQALGEKIVQKTKKRRWLFWLGLAVFLFGFSLLFSIISFNLSQKYLYKQLTLAIKSNGESIEKINESIIYSFFIFQYQQAQKILLEESLTQAADLVRLKETLLNLKASLKQYQQSSFTLYKKTLEGGVKLDDFHEEFLLSLDKKIEAERNYNAYLMDLNLELFSGEEQQFWRLELEQTKNSLRTALQLKKFLVVFSETLLGEGRVNLAVLVQDSNELRASGGLLSELILLSFENGFLVDRQTHEVGDLSTRVYGDREAPAEIKKIFGEEKFYLRDANWEADFVQVGEDVGWFIEQALGQRIDLIIALNSKTVQEIVQNQDGASLDDQQFFKFVKSLQKALDQRELPLYSKNLNLQQTIETNSWGGRKIDVICPVEFDQELCLTDSFFQLESSISKSKTGDQVSRQINHDIGVTENFIRHRRKIVFNNSSQNQANSSGEYQAFLKFYLHGSSNIEKIELNGRLLNIGEFEFTEGESRDELSLVIAVPGQSTLEVILIYTIPNQAGANFSYVFFDQKQPGIANKKTSYQVVFDESLIPQLVAPTAEYLNKTLSFTNDNIDHFLFAVNFSRGLSPK